MLNNKKLWFGIALWILLALIMVRDIGLVAIDLFSFTVNFFFGLFFSYYIIAYLFGWDMLNYGGLPMKKGKDDIWRTIMFIVFICFWLWGFFSFFRTF